MPSLPKALGGSRSEETLDLLKMPGFAGGAAARWLSFKGSFFLVAERLSISFYRALAS